MKKLTEKIIFGSKWLLIPFYFGLIFALFIYLYLDAKELWHIATSFRSLTEEDGIMMMLRLVDVIMIANLVKMIITGSYSSFVNKKHDSDTDKTSSGVLKVKMASSLIGVSSIHMLQTFLKANEVSYDFIYKQIFIHSSFLVGALVLAIIDYLHVKSEAIHNEDWDKKKNPKKESPNRILNGEVSHH